MMSTLWSLEIDGEKQDRAIGCLLFLKGVRAYQAALLLARKGLCTESHILIRSALECALHLAAVRTDPAHVKVLQDAHERHQITQAKGLLGYADRLDAKLAARVHDFVSHELPTGKSPNLEAMARGTGLDVLYQMVYRTTSGFAAHPTIGALERHVAAGADGANVLFAPEYELLDEAYYLLAPVGLELLNQIGTLLSTGEVLQKAIKLAMGWAAAK
ncbi:DUF5677 domain-containing protein [Ramlibacter sp.]|uniref:DUF5677 domain-containing protein n=1 Tax=Ramlibacter sp. TaxID=1917967 RepID=UPI00262275CD|nr:DUF5677 domain-containing protein [Ramlibacter sp.]